MDYVEVIYSIGLTILVFIGIIAISLIIWNLVWDLDNNVRPWVKRTFNRIKRVPPRVWDSLASLAYRIYYVRAKRCYTCRNNRGQFLRFRGIQYKVHYMKEHRLIL